MNKKSKNIVEYINNKDDNSLEVDANNRYNFDDLTKAFIHLYCEFSSLEFTCKQLDITVAQGEKLISQYNVQLEIKRINKAMYNRCFARQVMNLQDIGGYLTSLITDEVPVTKQLSRKDKLEAVKMLIALNIRQEELLQQPKTEIIIQQEENVEEELKKLSLASIKQLISTKENEDERKTIIQDLKNKYNYSIEELMKFSTMSIEELKKINSRVSDKEHLIDVTFKEDEKVRNLKEKFKKIKKEDSKKSSKKQAK